MKWLSRDETNDWFTIPGISQPVMPSDPPKPDSTQAAARVHRENIAKAEAALHVPGTTPGMQFGSCEPCNSEVGEADEA